MAPRIGLSKTAHDRNEKYGGREIWQDGQIPSFF
jgi:hypothetical protein